MLVISIKEEGMAATQAMLKTLQKMGTTSCGVALLDTTRTYKPGTSNSDIIERLAKADRDFFSLGNDEGKAMDVFVKEAIRRLEFQKTVKGKNPKAQANAVLNGALRKTIKHHIKQNVLKRMDAQRTADGGAPRQVNPEYAKWRKKRFGISSDIVGIASRSLKKAIAGGEIKLLKG